MNSPLNTGDAPETTPTPKVQREALLPEDEVQLAELCENAAKGWQASALPELLWLSKADFTAKAAAFSASVKEADAEGDNRTPQVRRLGELDQVIDKHLRYVKDYLSEAYGADNDDAYFPVFGITNTAPYRLPRERSARREALSKLLAALPVHGFEKRKYGTAFWQPIYDEYRQLLDDTTTTVGNRTAKVTTKDALREELEEALRALVHGIKANFRGEVVRAELRRFGFQKEMF
jgi:hypothetical protein